MARVTYIDRDGSCPSTRFHDVPFRSGEPVETSDPALIEAAGRNPWFSVSGEADTPQPDADPPASAGNDPAETFGAYSLKNQGRGWWSVMKGEEVVAENLRKGEAEAHAADLASADEA